MVTHSKKESRHAAKAWRLVSVDGNVIGAAGSEARRHLRTTWVGCVYSPRRAVRNDLDRDSCRHSTTLVKQVVHVAAAQIGKGLTCCVGGGGTVVLIHRNGPASD